MGVLGKDLFYYSNNFFEFTALFSADGVEIFDKFYKPCEITTDFLNYNNSEYIDLILQLQKAYDVKYEQSYSGIAEKINEIIKVMPLFADFKSRHNLLQADYFNPFFDEEKPSDSFQNADGYFKLAVDLETIDMRYKWFLKELFKREFPKPETQPIRLSD